MAYLTDEERLKKQHIVLMRHPETALYSGVFMMGESHVEDGIPTAYTDGMNKKYGREFMSNLKDDEARALIMHENLHVALMHISRHKDLMKESSVLANVAMDIVVNSVIDGLVDKSLCKLPEGAIRDVKYNGWSVREIYNDLKKDNPHLMNKTISISMGGSSDSGDSKSSGSGGHEVMVNGKSLSTDGGDEHDAEAVAGKTAEETKQMEEAVNRALREGGMLAGRLGIKVPRAIEDALAPEVDWKKEFQDYVKSSTTGKSEFSWRRFNRSLLANDILAPSMEDETITEVIFAVDASGSIGQAALSSVATELASACEVSRPEKVRILWWDTEVHSEQVFTDEYSNIKNLLKPQGGGGTRASCVSEYIIKNRLNPDCIVVFTDGYLEDNIKWDTSVDTLWLVNGNSRFNPPKGKKLDVDKL